MRSIARWVSMLALACMALATPLTSGSPAIAAPTPAAKPVSTPFGLLATGYGARVSAAGIVTADNVGWTALSCTNQARISKNGGTAKVDVPELGEVSGLGTRTWTAKSGATVSANSVHEIAGINLLRAGQGQLAFELGISAIRAQSRAWWDGNKFQAKNSTTVAKIRIKLPLLPAKDYNLPAPGKDLKVGPVTIGLGSSQVIQNKSGARAVSKGIKITINNGDSIPATNVVVARTAAQIDKSVSTGRFRGFSAGLQGKVLPLGGEEGDPLVSVGRTPLRNIPCVGTGGKVNTSSLAAVNLPGLASVAAAKAQVKAWTAKKFYQAWAKAQVADISLLNGRVKISGIKAQANVKRLKTGKLTSNTKGSSVASIVVDGTTYDIPIGQKVDIAGLVSIEPAATRKIANGREVIGVQIKLLDGTGATIDLAVARVQVLARN